MMTLEVDVGDEVDAEPIKRGVKALLSERFGVRHSTVEMCRGETL